MERERDGKPRAPARTRFLLLVAKVGARGAIRAVTGRGTRETRGKRERAGWGGDQWKRNNERETEKKKVEEEGRVKERERIKAGKRKRQAPTTRNRKRAAT